MKKNIHLFYTKQFYLAFLFIITVFISLFFVSCKKSSTNTVTMPTITTVAVTNITNTTATTGGTISTDGGAAITASGVVYGTSTGPTITNGTITTDGTLSGTFASNLIDLSANTLYYIRAYATNSAGTSYGTELTFTTLP